MIIMFVQSDKYNHKGLKKNKIAQCESGLTPAQTRRYAWETHKNAVEFHSDHLD